MRAITHTINQAKPTNVGISKLKTVCAFLKNGTCSRTLMTVLNHTFDCPMRTEESASDPLAGGLMQGYQCGMLWGSTLAAGARVNRLYGKGAQAEAYAMIASKHLVKAFLSQLHDINCLEITETDPNNKRQVFVNFLVKGGAFRCMGRAAEFAPKALKAINTALDEKSFPVSCNPKNCASRLAKKMGASDRQIVMAAGLAGGIGLSGGACGTLGAAIWILGIQARKKQIPNKVINQNINALIERFLKHTNYEFECFKIVGHKFKDIDNHSAYLEQGGCKKLIDAIAEAVCQNAS